MYIYWYHTRSNIYFLRWSQRAMELSDNGFNSRIWGPSLWFIMHILTLNYPLHPKPHHVKAYYNFFRSLCTILPCATCRKEFCEMVNAPGPLQLTVQKFMQHKDDFPGTARMRLTHYVINLHSRVNMRLKKKRTVRPPAYWVQKYARLRK